MVQNLKSQAYRSVKKMLQKIQGQQNRGITLHNKQQLVEQFTQECDDNQKLLINMMLGSNQDTTQITVQDFKANIQKLLNQIELDQNQFKPIAKKVEKPVLKKELPKSKFSQPSIDNNPEYYRVDYQLCNQLFNIYKQTDNNDPQKNLLSFQDQSKYNDTLTYHKILNMLKENSLQLDITQKLHLLRSIKKHSFNQNFISREEFTKVYKFIVHGLGAKETNLWKLVENKKRKYTIVKEKEKSTSIKRYLRIKTEMPLNPVEGIQSNKIRHLGNMKTEANLIPNQTKKVQEKPKTLSNSYEEPSSYLLKAIEKKKVPKITWESLFKMTQADKNSQIVIPDFIKRDFDK